MLICIFATLISFGQSTPKLHPSLIFDRLYSSQGLPDDRIRSMFQDSKGYIWMGTMNGICRYDGYSFKSYFKGNSTNSISANWALAICEDQADNIWIGTRKGLNKLDLRTEKFTTYQANANQPNSLPNNKIKTLQFDDKNNLWIGSPSGVSVFNPKTGNFKNFTTYPFNLSVSKIIKSAKGELWIANTNGVIQYNTKNNTHHFYPLNINESSYGDQVWGMLEHQNSLYLATARNGLIRLKSNPKTQLYDSVSYINQFKYAGINLNDLELFDITKSKTGDIWIGSAKGLVKIENIQSAGEKLTLYTHNPLNNKSLSSNMVYTLLKDKTDVLWCGTEMGLNKLDLNLLSFQYFTFSNAASKDQVRSIYTRDGNAIWIGTSNSGLYEHHLNTNTTLVYKNQPENSLYNSHRSIYLDKNNNVWIGTLGGTIKFNKNQQPIYQQEILKHITFAIFQDSKDNIWIGTTKGLFRISPDGTKTTYLPGTTKNSISSEYIRAIFEDHNGYIWVGFESEALSYMNPETGKFYKVQDQVKNNRLVGSNVYTILEYPKNTIWAGTESGLNRLNIQLNKNGLYQYSIKSYTQNEGLPNSAINGFLSDNNGNLWLATIKGLGRFNISNEKYQHFIHNLTFNYNCVFNFLNSKLYFGTTDGFVMFNPKHIDFQSVKPDLAIDEFKLFNQNVNKGDSFNGQTILNKSLSFEDRLVLNYKNNVFTIGFTALHFTNPENNEYAYKLEGFDKNWIKTTATKRNATYTNLDAGNYVFKVKASNSLGEWNNQYKSLKITILPPPWKTWWAYIIYVLLITFSVYIIFKYLLKQQRQEQQIRYQELQKEQLRHLDEMKMKFFTDISHELRTPLSLIVGPAEELVAMDLNSQGKNFAQLIQRNSKKLLYLMDELMTFQKMEQGKLELKKSVIDIVKQLKEIYNGFSFIAEKKKINYLFTKKIEDLKIYADPDKLEMIFNNLIYNSFKFTPEGGEICVCISATADEKSGMLKQVLISIEDTGKGILPDELPHLFERFYQSKTNRIGTGIGLSLTKSLIELHQGTISVESKPGIKTKFTISLPIPDLNFSTPEDQEISHEQAMSIGDHNAAILLETTINQDDSAQKKRSLNKLLLVEDNEDVLGYLVSIFNDKYKLYKANNGNEALAQLENTLPDLIISDVMMPEMDGIEFLSQVKSNIQYSHIPFILLTAKSSIEHKIEGYQIGADDYIPKPFNPALLQIRVEKLIETNKKLIEKFRSKDVVIPEDITTNPLDKIFLDKVLKYIEDNISEEDFNVEELGSAVAMSRSNLFRKIKAITGQSPVELIFNMRLRIAMDLLLERKLNISEIAYHVGFKSSSSFIKAFKKRYGKAPMEYLNSVIAGNS